MIPKKLYDGDWLRDLDLSNKEPVFDQNEHLKVTVEGKTIYLNGLLIERQDISIKDVLRLKDQHKERLKLVIQMEMTDNPIILKELNEKIIEIDFRLQELWGFPKNPDFHRFWEVPKCLCPKLDNQDNYGTPYRIIRDDCPIHFIKSLYTDSST